MARIKEVKLPLILIPVARQVTWELRALVAPLGTESESVSSSPPLAPAPGESDTCFTSPLALAHIPYTDTQINLILMLKNFRGQPGLHSKCCVIDFISQRPPSAHGDKEKP